MSLVNRVSSLAEKISNEILKPNFASVKANLKSDGSLVTIADQKAHEMLLEELPKIVDLPVLSEEMTELQQKNILDFKQPSYWCVDPLDGTSNYSQGIPYWCISIALIIEGEVTLGVIVDPNRNECFAATDKTTSTLNGDDIGQLSSQNKVMKLRNAMALIDFKRLDEKTAGSLATDAPYRSQRSFGASALDLCWIAANRCQVYLHGKQKLWDHAAGLLILKNAGGVAETFLGEKVFSNHLTSKSIIAASSQMMMRQWKDYFRSIQVNQQSFGRNNHEARL